MNKAITELKSKWIGINIKNHIRANHRNSEADRNKYKAIAATVDLFIKDLDELINAKSEVKGL